MEIYHSEYMLYIVVSIVYVLLRTCRVDYIMYSNAYSTKYQDTVYECAYLDTLSLTLHACILHVLFVQYMYS